MTGVETWGGLARRRASSPSYSVLFPFLLSALCGQAMLMISYSSTMFFITTIRMGLRYPFKGTLYLLLSSEPPM